MYVYEYFVYDLKVISFTEDEYNKVLKRNNYILIEKKKKLSSNSN